MKNITNYLSAVLLIIMSVFAVSCDNNDEIEVDPNANFDAVLEVKEAGPANPNKDVTVNANTTSTIKAKVAFTSTTKDMKRLYITQNVKGAGEVAYKPSGVDLTLDGAIDLTNKNSKDFEFQFDLPVPSGVGTDGTVVYKFWTTTGNGDFRDITQRLAVGAGTITLKVGTATNPGSGTALLKEYSAKILAAPLSDGTSLTFLSLINGNIYKIKDGAEYAALWDFGYYNTSAGASLASTSNYETSFPFVDVDGIAGTTDLNETFFALSTKSSAEFTAVTKSGDLTHAKPANQKISGLIAGNIIEFVDNYGKKGLIRVVEVKGTTGSGDYIKIDIKVQP